MTTKWIKGHLGESILLTSTSLRKSGSLSNAAMAYADKSREGFETSDGARGFLQEKVNQILEAIVENPGKGICLIGERGSLKTTALNAVWGALTLDRVSAGSAVKYHTWYSLTSMVLSDGVSSLRDVISSPFLAIDDVGLEEDYITYMGSRIDMMKLLFSARYDLRMNPVKSVYLEEVGGTVKFFPTFLFTTHLSMPELKAKYGDHIYQRIAEWFVPIRFAPGKSIRKTNAHEGWG